MINQKCNACDNLDSNANGLYCQILTGECSKEEKTEKTIPTDFYEKRFNKVN